MKKAAIVLAGGQAKRFQTNDKQWIDKAQAKLFGKPLLAHVIEGVKPVVDEVIVCVNSSARKRDYRKLLHEFSIKYVKLIVDRKFKFVEGGPIVGILTGLKATDAEYCMILPCDVPLIKPGVVDYLFNAAKNVWIAVPTHPNGRIEPLMMVCKRSKTLEMAEILCKLSRNRPDDLIRGAEEILFISTLELKGYDPKYESFININSQEDLRQLSTRTEENGPMKKSVRLTLSSPTKIELQKLKTASKYYLNKDFLKALNLFSSLSKNLENQRAYFWAALSRENEGKTLLGLLKASNDYCSVNTAFVKAAQNYMAEAKIYKKMNIGSLAWRASRDSKRLKSSIKKILKRIGN